MHLFTFAYCFTVLYPPRPVTVMFSAVLCPAFVWLDSSFSTFSLSHCRLYPIKSDYAFVPLGPSPKRFLCSLFPVTYCISCLSSASLCSVSGLPYVKLACILTHALDTDNGVWVHTLSFHASSYCVLQ